MAFEAGNKALYNEQHYEEMQMEQTYRPIIQCTYSQTNCNNTGDCCPPVDPLQCNMKCSSHKPGENGGEQIVKTTLRLFCYSLFSSPPLPWRPALVIAVSAHKVQEIASVGVDQHHVSLGAGIIALLGHPPQVTKAPIKYIACKWSDSLCYHITDLFK
jgi:hypothetical protein